MTDEQSSGYRSARDTATDLTQRLTDSLAMTARRTTDEVMAIIFEAREQGAREALLEVAGAARIPVRRDSRTSDLRNLLVGTLLGGDNLASPRDLAISDAIRAAAAAMGMSLLGSNAPGRKRALARVRWAVWQALRDLGYSLPAIARLDILGTCNHTTVLSGLARIESMRASDEEGKAMLAGIAAARSVLHNDTETT